MIIKCPNCNKEFTIDDALKEEINKESVKEALLEQKNKLSNEYEKKIEFERNERENLVEEKLKTLKEELRIEAINSQKEYLQEIEKRHQLKEREYEEKLSQTRKALKDASLRSDQGSGQQKGEALELTLEEELKREFVIDEIVEIKKGQAGGDVSQTVKNKQLKTCGVILYECKNAKWKSEWIDKLKKDVRDINANIGVLVSLDIPNNYKSITQIDNHIFLVKPSLAIVISSILRNQLISIAQFGENNKLKEEKMQILYQYLIGPEFRNRIESAILGYDKLLLELEKEKKASTQRWARQEKAILQMRESIFAMHGDLQGITGGQIDELKQIENNGNQSITVEALLSADKDG